MKTTGINPNMLDRDVTHKHSGNGWAIVQNVGDGYVRVCSVARDGIGPQAFLAYLSQLSVTVIERRENPKLLESPLIKEELPFSPEVMEHVKKLRDDLAGGKKKVVQTWIVDAEKAPF